MYEIFCLQNCINVFFRKLFFYHKIDTKPMWKGTVVHPADWVKHQTACGKKRIVAAISIKNTCVNIFAMFLFTWLHWASLFTAVLCWAPLVTSEIYRIVCAPQNNPDKKIWYKIAARYFIDDITKRQKYTKNTIQTTTYIYTHQKNIRNYHTHKHTHTHASETTAHTHQQKHTHTHACIRSTGTLSLSLFHSLSAVSPTFSSSS